MLRNAFSLVSTEAKQDAIITSLSAVLTELAQKLETGQAVALDSATLAALESITASIANFPSDYPDAAVLAKVEAVRALLAATLTIAGSVSVSNFPATQPISAASLPLPSGAATEGTLANRGTETTLALVKTAVQSLDTDIDVALSTRATEATLATRLTNTELRATPVPVSGTVATGGLTDTQLRASAPAVRDDYVGGEVLAQQSGAGAVLTFTFASAVQLVVLESDGDTLVSRADPYGGTPTASLGIPCRHQVPTYLPVTATTVRVYAPTGTVVNVWGMRR